MTKLKTSITVSISDFWWLTLSFTKFKNYCKIYRKNSQRISVSLKTSEMKPDVENRVEEDVGRPK